MFINLLFKEIAVEAQEQPQKAPGSVFYPGGECCIVKSPFLCPSQPSPITVPRVRKNSYYAVFHLT